MNHPNKESTEASREELERIGRATMQGWSFSNFDFNPCTVQRHSVFVRRPPDEGWRCFKVNADIKKGWVTALLDEAGAPV